MNNKPRELASFQSDLFTAIRTELVSNPRSRLLVLFAGGSLIVQLLPVIGELLQLPKEQQSRIYLSPIDERYSNDPASTKSNFVALLEAARSQLGLDLRSSGLELHPVNQGQDLQSTVAAQEEFIRSFLAPDCRIFNLLGMGADGHILGIMVHASQQAMLFNQSGVVGYTVDQQTVDMTNPHLDQTIAARITPGFPMLTELLAPPAWNALVVSGSSKLTVLRQLVSGEQTDTTRFPGAALRDSDLKGELVIYTDQEI